MTTTLEGGEGSASRPGRSLPPGKTRYPLYKKLGGPQDRSEQVRKISPAPGFDPRTVQPVASRYTDYATRPTNENKVSSNQQHTVQFLFAVTLHTVLFILRTSILDFFPWVGIIILINNNDINK